MKKILFFLSITSLFASCSPKVTTRVTKTFETLSIAKEVQVIGVDSPDPVSAIEIGAVSIKDNGMSLNCGWDEVIEKAKAEVRKAGGDILKITKHIKPSIVGSSCHQIKAKIFKSEGVSANAGYKDSIPMKAAVPTNKWTSRPKQDRFRFAVKGGYSYRIAKVSNDVPADFKSYIKELKSGYHFGGDFGYYWSENLGMGVKYSAFKASNQASNIYVIDKSGNRTTGAMSDDITIQFAGPVFYAKQVSPNQKTIFCVDFAIGYLGYQNNSMVTVNKLDITGSTVGLATDFSIDQMLSKSMSIGVSLASVQGVLTKYTVKNGTSTQTINLEKDKRESLSRIDFSLGLKWYIKPHK